MSKELDLNISELSIEQLKREIIVLKRENTAGIKTIDKLLKDLSQKTDKIKQLETLINQTAPVIKKDQDKILLNVAAEEEIAIIQLEKLRQTAKTRSLTLEEIRAYDLLVKNKRLSQDESTINLSKASYRDVSDSDLIQIASKNESDET